MQSSPYHPRILDLRHKAVKIQSSEVKAVCDMAVPQSTPVPSTPLFSVFAPVVRMVSIVLCLFVSYYALPLFSRSLAYFSDTEAGPAHLTTGLLDLGVTDPSDTVIGCGDMSDLEVPVYATTTGFMAMVAASTTALTGDQALCSALTIDVQYQGTTTTHVYSGNLPQFHTPTIGTGTLRFIASLPSGLVLDDAVSCTMHVGLQAWLAPYTQEESGFNDTEETQITFTVEPGTCTECPPPPCTACGDTTVITTTTNTATVTNNVVVSANTGGNSANGGSGHAGGAGGTITTGNATVVASSTTIVNSNTTTVTTNTCPCTDGCACDDTPPSGTGGSTPKRRDTVYTDTSVTEENGVVRGLQLRLPTRP